jgi:hypothetical protein
MFGIRGLYCNDYYLESSTAYPPPPVYAPASPMIFDSPPLPRGHKRLQPGEEIVVTTDNLSFSPGGTVYGPMLTRSRPAAASLRKQERLKRQK